MDLLAEKISKYYSEQRILKDISLEVKSGQCAAIIGPNGSGKTTLIRILSQLLRPSSGRVQYFNGEQEIKAEHIFRHISLVGPYLELYEELTAFQNLEFFARMKNISGYRERISDLMKRFGLQGREGDAVKTYSSGMKQRLKYVAALLSEPALLFVDEPRANLDEEGVATVYETLTAYKNKLTLVIATNDKEDLQLADRTVQVNA